MCLRNFGSKVQVGRSKERNESSVSNIYFISSKCYWRSFNSYNYNIDNNICILLYFFFSVFQIPPDLHDDVIRSLMETNPEVADKILKQLANDVV